MKLDGNNTPDNMKKMPFDIPDSYFSSLEDKLHEKIGGHKPDGAWGLYWRSLKAYAGVAAAFLMVCALGYGARELTERISGKRDFAKSAQVLEVETDTFLDSLESIYYTGIGSTLDNDAIIAEFEAMDAGNSGESNLTDEEIEEYLVQTPTPLSSLLADEISNLY